MSESETRGERILAEAAALAFPRYPGTEGDRRAIELVRQALEGAGLEVEAQAFSYDLGRAWFALRTVLVASGLLVAAAGWTLASRPVLAAGLLLAAVAPPGVFLAWAPGLERLYRREGATRTANLTGRRPCEGPRFTIVLMAHHDSKSQSLTLPWRLSATLVAVTGGLALVALTGSALVGVAAPYRALAPALGSLAALALLTLATLRSGNRSPGGVDNAGSLAIVLDLARVLPAKVADDVELVFLSPGAEEDHMVGAMRWLDRHRPEALARPVYTLNFDGAGNPGRLALLERYGFGRRFSATLSAAARRAARRLGIPVRGVFLPPGMGLDTIPFAHRGLETITFSSGALNRATVAVHSAGDRAENLDAPTLERAARLGEAIVEELAASA